MLFVVAVGAVAGALGALLGIGGGVFLVPLLLLVLQLPMHQAAGISLMTVIATSSAVSAQTARRQLVNLRLGMVLEIVTAAGALAGGLTASLFSERTLTLLFSMVTASIAVSMLGRIERRNVITDLSTPVGWFGGRFFDVEAHQDVVYRVRRMPVALVASLVAGNLSGLLGIGGGVLKVPALNIWCGVPMRAAAATSAFMLGVTALASVPIYYARGSVVPELAAAAVLGVQVGTHGGMRLSHRMRARWIKMLMALVLFAVSALMLTRLA
ncbi:MAG: sulfite exporter TauE/SafE family protein [Vicinamibacterales bacterium]